MLSFPFLICFLLLFNYIMPQQCEDQYLAVCVIAKDEPDIVEWIEYHKRMGVSKFYIFDHNSTVPLLYDILPYVRTGLVEYRIIVGEDYDPNAQLIVFKRCLEQFSEPHTFMAFIDVDEFIVVKDKTKKIPDILREYEDFGGLVLNWKMIGSSGHIIRPEGGVLGNYNTCGNNFHIKSIVNPRYTAGATWCCHYFKYIDGKFATDTSGKTVVPGAFNPAYEEAPSDRLYEVMYINHYSVKSVEDFHMKMRRGGPYRDMALFEELELSTPNTCEYLEMPEDTGDYCSPYS